MPVLRSACSPKKKNFMKSFKDIIIAGQKKILSALGVAVVSLFALSSCSEENIKDPDFSDRNDSASSSIYYFNVDIYFPSENSAKTRADEVTPLTNESKLEKIYLYLCTKDETTGQFTTLAELRTRETGGAKNGPNYTLTENTDSSKDYTHELEIEVEIEDLIKFVGKDMYLFMVGNPDEISNQTMSVSIKPENAEFSYTSSGGRAPYIELDNSAGKIMPLVNAAEFKTSVFANIAAEDPEEIEKAIRAKFKGTPSRGYGLLCETGGILDLERAIARVDYKDNGQQDLGAQYAYKIGESDFVIQLDRMQMFNLNSVSYLFRHTLTGDALSAYSGTNIIPSLFGEESEANVSPFTWVASVDWLSTEPHKSNSGLQNTLTKDDMLKYVTEDASFASIDIATLMKHPVYDDTENYHPWCYIYENTLPTVNLMTDANLCDYATGVAFTFKLLGNPDSEGKREVLTYDATGASYPANISNSTESGAADKKTITITMPDSQWMDLEAKGDDNHYELTYFAFLMHNEVEDQTSGTSTVPGPMRYGVVRNNVYQISISSVNHLPNPQEPRTIDLIIQCNVLPWNVRWDDQVTLY